MSKRDAEIYRNAGSLIGTKTDDGILITYANFAIMLAAGPSQWLRIRRTFLSFFDDGDCWHKDAVTALCFMAAMCESGDA